MANMINAVVFDVSGSMSGDPIATSIKHAKNFFSPDTHWYASDGRRVAKGLLKEIDEDARTFWAFMGPPGIVAAVRVANAPGVRVTVYSDEMDPTMDEVLSMLDGRGARIVIIGNDRHMRKAIAEHPGTEFMTIEQLPKA